MPSSKIGRGKDIPPDTGPPGVPQGAQTKFRQAAKLLSSTLRLHANSVDFHAKQSQSAIKAALENNGLIENQKLQITKKDGGHPKLIGGVPSSASRSAKLDQLKLGPKEAIHIENFGQKVSAGITAETLKVPALIKTQAASNQNFHSTLYHRDDYAPIKRLINDIIEHPEVKQSISFSIPACESEHGVFVRLVGSSDFAQRYNLFFNSYISSNSDGAIQFRISDSVHVLLIPYHDTLLEKLADYGNRTQLDSIYHYLGGPPSVSALKNALYALSQDRFGEHRITRGKTETTNDSSLLRSLSILKDNLENMQPDTALLGEIAFSMINDLIEIKSQVNQHPASNDIFRQVSNYLTGISQSQENFGLCHELLDSVFEEVNLLLNLSKPYKQSQAHALQEEIYRKELACLGRTKNVSVMSRAFTSSGMHAIGAALEHVINLQKSQSRFHGIRQLTDQGPNYYEVPLLTKALMTDQPSSLILANLNPSSWVANRQPGQLADEVLKTVSQFAAKNETVYLLMDTTIDSATGELNDVVERLQVPLQTGELRIFLCKSYQKYAALGSGKVSMGNVTELGTPEASARFSTKSMQSSNEHFQNNNGQFLTHLLRSNHLSVRMIQAATDNAKFLSQFCWPMTKRDPATYFEASNSGSTALDNLPFLFRAGSPNRGTTYIMATQGVKSRLTFGFLESSICPIGNFYRINTGVESRARLVEQFFATGQVLGRTTFYEPALEAIEKLTAPEAIDALTAEEAGSKTPDATTAACDFFYTAPKNGTRKETLDFIQQYEANIKASLLLLNYAYDLSGTPYPIDTLQKTRALIDSGFKGKAAGSQTVTPEAQEALLHNYLSRTLNSSKLHKMHDATWAGLLNLIKKCNANTRLSLLCNTIPDSFFQTSKDIQREIFRDNAVEVLIKNIRPDLLADACRLRLMNHSTNLRATRDSSFKPRIGINLAKTIEARLEKTINHPALLPDLMEDDLQEISHTVRDREISALNKLKGAIKLHDTLKNKQVLSS